MGRTTIDIDDRLIAEAMRKYRLGTRQEAVDLALRRLVGSQLPSAFLERLEGIGWEGDFDQTHPVTAP